MTYGGALLTPQVQGIAAGGHATITPVWTRPREPNQAVNAQDCRRVLPVSSVWFASCHAVC
jgi:hypothetical protein